MSPRPSPPPPAPSRRSRILDWLVAGAVVEIAFAAFLPALQGDFVSWDDEGNFLYNPHYRGLGPPQLKWMFTTMGGHYMPLTWLTLGLDHVLWGMRPGGYHLTSLILHALAAAAAYFVALRVLAAAVGPEPRGALRGASALTALLFAVHPLRVESVAWITERRDVLCGLFVFLSLALYLRAAGRDGTRRAYWASVAMAALALLSKAIAVPLPAVLLLLDVYPLRRLGPGRWTTPQARRVWLEKLPFVALSAAASVMAIVAQHSLGSLSKMDIFGWSHRIAMSSYSLVFYVWKTLVPVHLAPLYEVPFELDPFWPRFLVSMALALVGLVALVLVRPRWPAVTAAGAAFIVLLLPTLGIVHFGPHLAADRNTYLAGLAPAMLVGGSGLRLWRERRQVAPRVARAAAGAAVVALAVLAVLTWRQSTIWRDSDTLWRHALRTSPSAIAHAKLGMLLDDTGRYEEAIEQYREAVRLHPDMALAFNLWGVALGHLERYDEALVKFNDALRVRPDYEDAQHNRQVLLRRASNPSLYNEVQRARRQQRKIDPFR